MCTDNLVKAAAIAAACIDAGIIKVANEDGFGAFLLEDLEESSPVEQQVLNKLASLPEAGEKTAAELPAFLSKKESRVTLQDLIQRIQDMDTAKRSTAAGAALGALLGGYLGNETKTTRDLIGMPYTYDYEF